MATRSGERPPSTGPRETRPAHHRVVQRGLLLESCCGDVARVRTPDRRRHRRLWCVGGRGVAHSPRAGVDVELTRAALQSPLEEQGGSVEPLIIEVAINELASKHDNPNIPYSVDEVVDEAIACARAGAAIVHFHARDAETGAQRWHDTQFYREAFAR